MLRAGRIGLILAARQDGIRSKGARVHCGIVSACCEMAFPGYSTMVQKGAVRFGSRVSDRSNGPGNSKKYGKYLLVRGTGMRVSRITGKLEDIPTVGHPIFPIRPIQLFERPGPVYVHGMP